nr:MAG TPA: hypothetical protein [Caudoviricetes sp.]
MDRPCGAPLWANNNTQDYPFRDCRNVSPLFYTDPYAS